MIKRNLDSKGNSSFELLDVKVKVMISKEETECTEIIMKIIPPGGKAPMNSHEEIEQIYFVLKGTALVTLNKISSLIKKDDLLMIPRGLVHTITNTGKEDFQYLCFGAFPERIPKDEKILKEHEEIISKKIEKTNEWNYYKW